MEIRDSIARYLTSAHRRAMNDIWLAVAAVGVRSCQPPVQHRGKPRPSRGLIPPCFYPGFTPIFESEAITIRPNQGSSQAEGHGFDPRRPLQQLAFESKDAA